MTPQTVSLTTSFDKPATIKIIPPRQPLPTAVIDPAKPLLKLGLDVHLEFIMAVAQKHHANSHAPRKFTREQLVAQVKKWVAEGCQSFVCRKAAALALCSIANWWRRALKVFSSRPSRSTATVRPTSSDARALRLRLSRWLHGNRDATRPPSAFLPEAEQHKREGTRRRRFLSRGHPQSGQSRAQPGLRVLSCPTAAPLVGSAQLEPNWPPSIRGCWACWPSCAN